MIRQLQHNDIGLMIEVIQTRDTLMTSTTGAVKDFSSLTNETIFNSHIAFGLFGENGLLDCFIHINVWEELPMYSWTVYTRYKENREKNEKGRDKNLSELRTYCFNYMTNILKIYTLINAMPETWEMARSDTANKRIVSIFEIIPPNQLSRYSLVRTKLLRRRYDVALKVFTVTSEPLEENAELKN